jgi:hypothetical protein
MQIIRRLLSGISRIAIYIFPLNISLQSSNSNFLFLSLVSFSGLWPLYIVMPFGLFHTLSVPPNGKIWYLFSTVGLPRSGNGP